MFECFVLVRNQLYVTNINSCHMVQFYRFSITQKNCEGRNVVFQSGWFVCGQFRSIETMWYSVIMIV